MLQSENAASQLQFPTRRIYPILYRADYTDLAFLGQTQERADRGTDPRPRDSVEEAQEPGKAA